MKVVVGLPSASDMDIGFGVERFSTPLLLEEDGFSPSRVFGVSSIDMGLYFYTSRALVL